MEKRLQKFISEEGVMSRRAAEEEIKRGNVTVNGVRAVARRENLSAVQSSLLERLVTVYGAPDKVLPALKELAITPVLSAAIAELEAIVAGLCAMGISEKLIIDFSVVNDMNYYNGIAFKGFVYGIPVGILSGGEYDGLLKKMQKNEKGIGFAVYLDELSRLGEAKGETE